MKTKAVPIILCIILMAGCAALIGTNTPLDQAIQYRSAFNTMLAQWNLELSGMPIDQQKAWAQKAIPFVQAGVMALDTMDLTIGAGSQPTPDTIQQYLMAKNRMIDLLAQLILAKKGGK
jgi:hypothetical protein